MQPGEENPIGSERSRELFHELVERGYLTKEGRVTDKFAPKREGFVLDTSDAFRKLRAQICDIVEAASFTSRVRNARERKRIKLRKEVQLTPEFEELWRRISRRTKYSVEFVTAELIEKALGQIERLPPTPKLEITTTRHRATMTHGGMRGETVRETTAQTVKSTQLPDILGYLQNETRLTRKTLARILLDSGRLGEFRGNPVVFSKDVLRAINAAMSEIVEEGVTYHRIEDLA